MWLTHPNRSDRHTLPEQIHPHHPSRNIHRIRPNGGCAIQATPAPPHHGRSRCEADERSRSRVERHPPAPQVRSLSPSAASEFLSSSRLRIASWVVFQAIVDPHVPAPGGNGQDRIGSVRTEAATRAGGLLARERAHQRSNARKRRTRARPEGDEGHGERHVRTRHAPREDETHGAREKSIPSNCRARPTTCWQVAGEGREQELFRKRLERSNELETMQTCSGGLGIHTCRVCCVDNASNYLERSRSQEARCMRAHCSSRLGHPATSRHYEASLAPACHFSRNDR